MTRISLDLDLPVTEAEARAAVTAVRYITGHPVRLYRTASGGHHVETDDIPALSMLDALALRRYLHDDPERIKRDVARITAREESDFLFTKKRNTQRVRLI